MFRYPSANAAFWRAKIQGNIARDRRQHEALLIAGWRVLTVWECAMRGKTRLSTEAVIQECARWLRSDEREMQLRGDLPSSPKRVLVQSGFGSEVELEVEPDRLVVLPIAPTRAGWDEAFAAGKGTEELLLPDEVRSKFDDTEWTC